MSVLEFKLVVISGSNYEIRHILVLELLKFRNILLNDAIVSKCYITLILVIR